MTRWRWPLALLAMMLALLALMQREAWASMLHIWWTSESYAHALLIPAIVAWLVWRQRQRLLPLTPRVAPAGLALLGLGGGLALVGELAQLNAARHFALVFQIQGATWLLLGPAVTRRLAFPLLFLLFAPPFGDFLLPPMMEATADFTIAALRLSGVPVFREGLQFVIPSGHWSVVEACSGVRYLMASLMVGALFAYLNFDSLRKRLVFVLFAGLLPLVANWLRAYLIVMLGHLTNNVLATGADHLVYGWVFFGFVMLLMFWIGGRFADPLRPAPVAVPDPVPNPPWPRHLAWALLGTALVALPWSWGELARAGVAEPHADMRSALQAPLLPAAQPAERMPGLLHGPEPDARLRQSWVQQGEAVQLEVAYFARQRAQAKAIGGTNQVVDRQDERWQLLAHPQPGLDAPWQHWQLRDRGTGAEWRLRQAYWIDGAWIGSPARAKTLALWQLLRGRGDAVALVSWWTRDDPGAEVRLDAAWGDLRAPLNARLSALTRRMNPSP